MTTNRYTPTRADYLTGRKIADLRRLAGETLIETIDRSGVPFGQATLSRIENGQRWISYPEATKLAAHFNTTAEKIIVKDTRPALAALPPLKIEDAPMLGVVIEKPSAPPLVIPEPAPEPEPTVTLTIDLDNPMHPDDYRLTVWLPYLEARYNEDERKTA